MKYNAALRKNNFCINMNGTRGYHLFYLLEICIACVLHFCSQSPFRLWGEENHQWTRGKPWPSIPSTILCSMDSSYPISEWLILSWLTGFPVFQIPAAVRWHEISRIMKLGWEEKFQRISKNVYLTSGDLRFDFQHCLVPGSPFAQHPETLYIWK